MSPWLYLGAVLAIVGAFLAGNVHGSRAKDTEWQAKWNKFQAEMFATAADAQKKAREAESANAALTAELEATRHAAELQIADKDRAVRNALAAARLRARQACAGPGGVPGPAAAGGVAEAADRGVDGLAERVDELTARTAAAANTLAAYARECHGWVTSLAPH